MRRTSVVRCLALLGFLAFPSAAVAQGVTTAAVNGRVTGQDLAPLGNAVVTATHTPSGTSYSTVTRQDGRYNLAGLRVGGPYTIAVSLIGYGPETLEGQTLTLGEDRRVDFVLAVQAVAVDELTVTAERDDILSGARQGPQRNVSSREIAALPTIARSVQDFARLTPQAVGTNIGDSENIGGFTLGGKNNRYNNIQVDGAILNDVFGLPASGTPGGQANSQPISLDAVQEFQVALAPFDVRQGGFTGGSVNIITRSGTNDLEGSAYYFGRNDAFVGELDGNEISNFDEFQAGFRVGGPIARDRVFFFLSGEIKETGRPLSLGLQGSSLTNTIDISQARMDSIIDITRTVYSHDPGDFSESLARATDDFKIFGRLDFNLSEAHKLTVRHNHVNAVSERGIEYASFEVGLPSTGYDFDAVTNSTVAELNSRLGNTTQNMLRLAYQRQRDQRNVDENNLFPEVDIEPTPGDGASVVFGTERSSQQNALDQDIFEITNDLTFFKGRHAITVGTHNEFFSFSNLFIQQAFGAWEFDGDDPLTNYRNGIASRYRASISRLDDPFPRAEFSAMQLGFYVQDKFDISDRVNVTAGLRADIPIINDEPLDNPGFSAAFPEFSTTEVPSGNVMISPRVGINAALDEDRRTQIRAGTGIFTGRNPFVWISNQFSNTGLDFIRIDCSASRGCQVPLFDGSITPPTAGGVATTTEVDIVSPDFKFPQVWRTSIGVDRELVDGLVATVEGVFTDNVNDVLFQDLALVPEGTAADGRILFSDDAVDPEFAPGVILMDNTGAGSQRQLTLQLQKEVGTSWLPNLFGSIAYTNTNSEDVNGGQSSTALSNFQFNSIGIDPNDPQVGTSDFEIKHRFIASASYYFDWGGGGDWGTTLTGFYEARSGRPFSYLYDSDANNDGRFGNDLIFVPGQEGDAIFVDGTFAEWDTFVNSDENLAAARGQIVGRNVSTEPSVKTLDLRIAQDVPFPGQGSQRLQLTLDIVNVGNLLNGDWGRQRFIPFQEYDILEFEGYDSATGLPMVGFDENDSNGDGVITIDDIFDTDNLLSRWAIQLGARISF